MLNMDICYEANVLLVRFNGVLIHNTSYKINDYLLPLILRNNIKCLVFNMNKLTDIDEWGIDSLLNCKTAIKNNEGKIYTCEIPKNLIKKIKHSKIKRCKNEGKAFSILEAY